MILKSKQPWRMLFPAATVLVLFGIWSGYWFIAQAQAKAALKAEREKLAAKGFILTCQQESWGGYPFRFEFSCAKPILRFNDRTEVRAETLLMLAQTYDPKHIVGLAEGPTRLQLPSGKQFEARHDSAVASLIGESQGPRVSAVVNNLWVNDSLAAKHIEFHSRPSGGGGSDMAFDVEAINLLEAGNSPFFADQFQLRAQLTQAAELSMQTIALRVGTVELTGSGTVGLDEIRRPTGQINVTGNDPERLLKLIEPHFDASEQERAAVRALFAFFGKGSSIAILARNGELFIGPFKATDLEPLY